MEVQFFFPPLNPVFPIFIAIFPNLTGPGPQLQKDRKIPDLSLHCLSRPKEIDPYAETKPVRPDPIDMEEDVRTTTVALLLY